jgi:hypothetical protein
LLVLLTSQLWAVAAIPAHEPEECTPDVVHDACCCWRCLQLLLLLLLLLSSVPALPLL